MRTLTDLSDLLRQPLDRQYVKTRAGGGGKQLSYLTGHHVINEANTVFNFDGWTRTLKSMDLTYDIPPDSPAGQWRVGYRATVIVRVLYLNVDGRVASILREGTGHGNGSNKNPDAAHELACKEAETDAMKRAFMTFGMRFGLALYYGDDTHVVDVPKHLGKAASRPIFSGLEADCHKIMTLDALSSWWKNKDTQATINNMHPDFVAHIGRVKDEAKERLI